ncbi:MAG: hypothetical protein KatS3mg076_0531 [Candidatus Binatia bacterium]|nr:MAG: hypothetical protein KatS3mg076_0531 [Candidatus Binatia bacterium]
MLSFGRPSGNTALRAHAKEKGGAISLAARELRIGPSCVLDATGEDDGTITLTHAGPFEIAESARFRPEPEIEEDEMLEACESED